MEDFTAGVYRQQREYKSFSPSFINCPFTWENRQIDQLVEQAAHLLGALNAYAEIVPDVDFAIPMSIAKEAIDSNLIEGTKTEIDEVVLPQSEIPSVRQDDWQEVQNYIAAMNFAIAELPRIPISMRLLKDVHKILLSGVRGKHKAPGEIRRSQNWIGGSSLSDAIFVPPSPEALPDLLSDLEKFWHNESLQLPFLIKIAITHYQFETIHPFLDGNGRCGRLLIVLQLIDAQLLNKPALYASTFFEKNKVSYYNSLTRVRTANDLEQWIVFFLLGIVETAQHGLKTFKGIIALRQEYDAKILTLGSRARNAQKLLQRMYANPIVNARWVEKELDISFSSASLLLKSLTELDILKETTGHSRNRLFVLEKYLNLFRD
ncbi:Fic family protein [Candidatus Poribacteria bacterium]|nr:Fic family protein [Candidatus Poribacteria bacterium]MYA58586.1 Fic family protein [Candidatus Poribacteria bacterium]